MLEESSFEDSKLEVDEIKDEVTSKIQVDESKNDVSKANEDAFDVQDSGRCSKDEKDAEQSDEKTGLKRVEDLKTSDEGVTDPVESTKEAPAQGMWGSWKGWGSNIISSAANQVSHFTNQVGDGLMHVLESVEKEEEEEVLIDNDTKEPVTKQSSSAIAKNSNSPKDSESIKDSRNIIDDDASKETVALGTVIEGNKAPWWIEGLGSVVRQTTSVLEHTTKTVVHGGLDVLEVVGKKTYSMISDGDHGLKNLLKKRHASKNEDMCSLSQVLSEARVISEMRLREEEEQLEGKRHLYSYWFDEYQGLLQLEAFELLCRENELKTRQDYEALSGENLVACKEALQRLSEVYKTEEEEEEEEEDDATASHDFPQLLLEYATKLPVVLSVQKIQQCQEETKKLLEDYKEGRVSKVAPKDLYKEALRCLAFLTSLSIQHYHKLAQLLLRSSSSPSLESSSSPSESSSELPSNVSSLETASIIIDFSRVLRREMMAEANLFVSLMASLESKKSSKDAVKKAEGSDNDDSDNKGGADNDGGKGGADNDDDVEEDYNNYITSIYVETSNSGRFVLRCLKLLLPALQLSVLKQEGGREE